MIKEDGRNDKLILKDKNILLFIYNMCVCVCVYNPFRVYTFAAAAWRFVWLCAALCKINHVQRLHRTVIARLI